MDRMEWVLDMSDVSKKTDLLRRLGQLQGPYEIIVKKRKRIRSLRANAYYWGVVVPALEDVMKGQGESLSGEDCHELLKAKFLRVAKRVVNQTTGEETKAVYVRSTASLNSAEFYRYVEDCRRFLAEWFGVVVPDPGVYGVVQDEQETAA